MTGKEPPAGSLLQWLPQLGLNQAEIKNLCEWEGSKCLGHWCLLSQHIWQESSTEVEWLRLELTNPLCHYTGLTSFLLLFVCMSSPFLMFPWVNFQKKTERFWFLCILNGNCLQQAVHISLVLPNAYPPEQAGGWLLSVCLPTYHLKGKMQREKEREAYRYLPSAKMPQQPYLGHIQARSPHVF